MSCWDDDGLGHGNYKRPEQYEFSLWACTLCMVGLGIIAVLVALAPRVTP